MSTNYTFGNERKQTAASRRDPTPDKQATGGGPHLYCTNQPFWWMKTLTIKRRGAQLAVPTRKLSQAINIVAKMRASLIC